MLFISPGGENFENVVKLLERLNKYIGIEYPGSSFNPGRYISDHGGAICKGIEEYGKKNFNENFLPQIRGNEMCTLKSHYGFLKHRSF